MNLKEKLKKFLIFQQRIGLDEKIFFTKNLLVMIKAGLSLSHSLKILSEQTKNKRFKLILEEIRKEVEGGSALSESLAKYKDVFPMIFVNMIEAGEKSGQLEKVLEEISDQMKKTRELSSKLKRALTYPAFIIFIMILIGIFALTFVIPKMMAIFEEVKVELPLPTKILIFISNFIVKNGYLILIGIFILGFCFLRIIKTKKGKYIFDSFLLKMPIVGPLLKKINLIKFSRTFSSLLKSGISLVQTFEITANVLNNILYQEKVRKISLQTAKGITISAVLSEDPDLFPPVITQMIEVGEKTGTLENILEDLIEFYESDVDETLSNFTSIIEPVLIVVLGVGVAILALSIIMPMYTLVQAI